MSTVTAERSARTRAADTSSVDAAALVAELRARIEGEVRFDDGARALYATDASNYRHVPIGVVIPRTVEDVVETVAVCRDYGAPVLARGGGTSLAGQSCNVAVVIDYSKYLNEIVTLDPEKRLARVQPGTVLDDLREAAERHRLTFGPDPATHDHCTLGGMIGNNSCGVHSVMAGKTVDNVEELEILTYDGLRLRVGPTSDRELERIIGEGGRRGEIYARLKSLRDRSADLIRARFPDIPRRVSGYNLDQLLPENGFNVARALVGSEGTCALVLEATVRLVESPPGRVVVVVGYPDIFQAGDHVSEILQYRPIGLEGIDDRLTEFARIQHVHPDDIKLLPDGHGWLLIEFGGSDGEAARDQAERMIEALQRGHNAPAIKLFTDPRQQRRMWAVREAGLGATTFLPNGDIAWPGWEDAAVPPDKVGMYLREFRALLESYGYDGSLYGHFGDGCIHTSTNFDLESTDGIARCRAFLEAAADLVIKYGGSLSGEHGDGQARGWLLPKLFGPELVDAFREFKAIWDPDGKMNPGKVVDPYGVAENLRLGTHYRPPAAKTHFTFPDDGGSFARATLRCVGIGECRRGGGGTMCPSFMVLREEMHTTRGRARLLFEMLQGDPLRGGWQDEHVKEALDLCLACKGCKGDCPVKVDMATYKAEFLSHYYAGRLRPPHAYAFGLIMYWAMLASRAPGLVNFVAHAPFLSDLAKMAVGMAPARRFPSFASQTFKEWFRRRGPRHEGRPQVILWADTFNNHFHPETGAAAVEVLEAAGYRVTVPEPFLCCGRPFYDYGMLDMAKRHLRTIIDTLRPQLQAGVHIVGLEPSCVAVFRDELRNLFPHDADAKRLGQQTLLLSEFLTQTSHFEPPPLRRNAVVHGHCHQKAIMRMHSDVAVLDRMGLDYDLLESGCCGMAGAFGFEKNHYELSVKCGERILLPAVRGAAKNTLVIADGFSCREQIAQLTDRRALHLAQVLQLALREGPAGPAGDYPERGYLGAPAAPQWRAAMAGVGTVLTGAAVGQRLMRRRSE